MNIRTSCVGNNELCHRKNIKTIPYQMY